LLLEESGKNTICSRLLCYHRYSRWYFFHTLLKATYYAAVTGFMCCHRSTHETCYSSIVGCF
jgi:hypothetical protein